MRFVDPTNNPLINLDESDDFQAERLTKRLKKGEEQKLDPGAEVAEENICESGKKAEEFRNYQDGERQKRVMEFYRLQHEKQTFEFVKAQQKKYNCLDKCEMGIWECLELLDTLVDESDPDTDVSQLQHALMTAEAIRKAYPGEEFAWFPVVGLIHDLGKILSLKWEEPQWAVVGDTFPVGCKYSDKNVFPQMFETNPDSKVEEYQTELGIYEKNCGLRNVNMSWGHDEYLYQVCVKNGCTLPMEGLYMIRFHSFYPWHKEGAYTHLTDETDKQMLEWVKKFNPFDLYSKGDLPKDVTTLCEFYKAEVLKYFPETLKW